MTGDTPQGTMGRVQTRPLSPSCLPLRAYRERRLGTRQGEGESCLLSSGYNYFGIMMHELGENDSSECSCMSLLNEILATSLLIQ